MLKRRRNGHFRIFSKIFREFYCTGSSHFREFYCIGSSHFREFYCTGSKHFRKFYCTGSKHFREFYSTGLKHFREFYCTGSKHFREFYCTGSKQFREMKTSTNDETSDHQGTHQFFWDCERSLLTWYCSCLHYTPALLLYCSWILFSSSLTC